MKIKSIILFASLLLVFSAASALIDQPQERPKSETNCSNITSLGLAKYGIMLDNEKVLAFFNADDDSLSYYCVKNILGLWEEDFYFEITYLNGTYVVLNDTVLVYGVYPGRTTNLDIIKQVSNTQLADFERISPSYVSVDTYTKLDFQIQQQRIAIGVCQPTSCNASQIQQIESLDYSHIQIGKIIPDVYNYKNVRTFSRLALLNIDGQSSLVTATMGVWN